MWSGTELAVELLLTGIKKNPLPESTADRGLPAILGGIFFFPGSTGPFIYPLGWSDQFRCVKKVAPRPKYGLVAEINKYSATTTIHTRSEAKAELGHDGTQPSVDHTGVEHMRRASLSCVPHVREQGRDARRGLAKSGPTQNASDGLVGGPRGPNKQGGQARRRVAARWIGQASGSTVLGRYAGESQPLQHTSENTANAVQSRAGPTGNWARRASSSKMAARTRPSDPTDRGTQAGHRFDA